MQQDELARAIGGLGQEAFGAAMGLLVGRAPELHPGACDMIVDMDRLDALTLRQLQHFAATADDAAAACGGVGGGAAAGPGGGGEAAPATEAPIVWPGLLAGNGAPQDIMNTTSYHNMMCNKQHMASHYQMLTASLSSLDNGEQHEQLL